MKVFIIKMPKDKNSKWSLQQTGVPARRFRNAHAILNRFKKVFPRMEFREKTAIMVKRYVDGSFVTENETVSSKDPKYLIYATACFLEDFISPEVMRSYER